MKRRDLIKLLEAGGFKLFRDDGPHSIYKALGKPRIPVPRHREIDENTAKQIIKDAGLI